MRARIISTSYRNAREVNFTKCDLTKNLEACKVRGNFYIAPHVTIRNELLRLGLRLVGNPSTPAVLALGDDVKAALTSVGSNVVECPIGEGLEVLRLGVESLGHHGSQRWHSNSLPMELVEDSRDLRGDLRLLGLRLCHRHEKGLVESLTRGILIDVPIIAGHERNGNSAHVSFSFFVV